MSGIETASGSGAVGSLVGAVCYWLVAISMVAAAQPDHRTRSTEERSQCVQPAQQRPRGRRAMVVAPRTGPSTRDTARAGGLPPAGGRPLQTFGCGGGVGLPIAVPVAVSTRWRCADGAMPTAAATTRTPGTRTPGTRRLSTRAAVQRRRRGVNTGHLSNGPVLVPAPEMGPGPSWRRSIPFQHRRVGRGWNGTGPAHRTRSTE